MQFSSLVELAPALIFFIAFSVVFSVVELIIVLFLNAFTQSHWEWFVDVVISARVHHRKTVRAGIVIFVILFIALIATFTPLLRILNSAEGGFRVFAGTLALLMVLIFLLNVRDNTKIHIARGLYALIFFVISLLFTFILIFAEKSYSGYVHFVNSRFVKPAIIKVSDLKNEKEKSDLMRRFKQIYLNSGCDLSDLSKIQNQNKLNILQFIGQDVELSYGDGFTNHENPEEVLLGMMCSEGTETMILSEDGSWYLVQEEKLNTKNQ